MPLDQQAPRREDAAAAGYPALIEVVQGLEFGSEQLAEVVVGYVTSASDYESYRAKLAEARRFVVQRFDAPSTNVPVAAGSCKELVGSLSLGEGAFTWRCMRARTEGASRSSRKSSRPWLVHKAACTMRRVLARGTW